MLYDEPTMSLDPIGAIQVLDLVIRARDINHISLLYVTKKIHEIPYLSSFIASLGEDGEVVITEAPPDKLPETKVIVLDQGSIVFSGTVAEFQRSDLPVIKELVTLDRHVTQKIHTSTTRGTSAGTHAKTLVVALKSKMPRACPVEVHVPR